jgi:precorrin-6B methylase 2
MPKRWTADSVLAFTRSYQGGCILMAAAEVDLFSIFTDKPLTAAEIAGKLGCDLRGVTMLLDALAALEILSKRSTHYSAGPTIRRLLTAQGQGSVLAMMQHQANCIRRWTQLAKVIKTGKLAERVPSIRGEAGDQASFITAMDNISGPLAPVLVSQIGPLEFEHLLDVGGASGTWTIAFLQSNPDAVATIFDLPAVIPMAEERIARAGMADRVQFAGGDFLADPLPKGADLAWISAIVHQNSREQNRRLFTAVAEALAPGGRILIRDVVMEDSRTAPVMGALFAINMLVGTEGGATFTFEELREDLEAAGLTGASMLRRDAEMSSIVQARKAP